MEQYEEENKDRLIIEDQYGNEMEFDVVAAFYVDDRNYMAVHRVDDEDEWSVVLFRMKEEEDGSLGLENIDDAEEYNLAADVFEQLFNDAEDEAAEEIEEIGETEE